jgi:uncharacterized protein DUF5650/dockerin type I repeat protein
MFGWLHRVAVLAMPRAGRRIRKQRKASQRSGRLWIEAFEDRRMFAAGFGEFIDPHPADGNQFGASVVPLKTGNVVITSPFDDAGGTDAGAVYLFNGRTGALISTLTGSHANDQIGSNGVVPLPNGNYVVRSPLWDNGAVADAGAATFGNGTSGVSGLVSAANSLVGSTASDEVGSDGITVLASGNYVAVVHAWDNGAMANAGAVTFGGATSGVLGAISAANSLIGSTASDFVGLGGVTPLTNGNYVVSSPSWSDGSGRLTKADVGAVTFASGTAGIHGTISSANSLIGGTSNDQIGGGSSPQSPSVVGGVQALANGSFLVISPFWDNGGIEDAGAVTRGNAKTGVSGLVTATNSLVGSTANDHVGGAGRVTELTNGNYVVNSPDWDATGAVDAGAVTFANGATGIVGPVSATNSLVGSTAADGFSNTVTALANGNFVVASPFWNSQGGVVDAGAATFGNGGTGITGPISTSNSLVGDHTHDEVGLGGVMALANGNYVVASNLWSSNLGAATFGNGTTGMIGVVDATNSLVGSTADDFGITSVTPLTNGNYVVGNPFWDHGGLMDVGAVTFGSGTAGISGPVTTANSLVGFSAEDNVGTVTALKNGNYVVQSQLWDNSETGAMDAGAVTFGSGTSGVTGFVSSANSLVGSTSNDLVGSVIALASGNYVVVSPSWDSGGLVDAGAATFVNGASGLTGQVSDANSLIGSTAGDRVGGGAGYVTPLANGNYVVVSPSWDNASFADAGAATFGAGVNGVQGVINSTNSARGLSSSTDLAATVIVDNVNSTFFVVFLDEGGGHVRVGSQIDGFAHPWHFAAKPTDVTNDGLTAPNDLTAIISYLNGFGASDVPKNASIGKPFGFIDANGDDQVAPNDLTKVISYLNAFGAGEGESAVQSPKSNVQSRDTAEPSNDQVLMLLAMDASQQATRKK